LWGGGNRALDAQAEEKASWKKKKTAAGKISLEASCPSGRLQDDKIPISKTEDAKETAASTYSQLFRKAGELGLKV